MTRPLVRALLSALLALAVLGGCDQLGIGKDATADPDAPATVITGEAIEVTALDAPSAGAATSPETAAPEAKPSEAAAPEAPPAAPPAAEAPATEPPAAETAPPPPPKPPQQIACEKKGGQWATAGQSGIKTCLARTRDSGKRCTRGTQCQGECLARSNTCAPYKPLFGCNDILQDDGRRVTLCID